MRHVAAALRLSLSGSEWSREAPRQPDIPGRVYRRIRRADLWADLQGGSVGGSTGQVCGRIYRAGLWADLQGGSVGGSTGWVCGWIYRVGLWADLQGGSAGRICRADLQGGFVGGSFGVELRADPGANLQGGAEGVNPGEGADFQSRADIHPWISRGWVLEGRFWGGCRTQISEALPEADPEDESRGGSINEFLGGTGSFIAVWATSSKPKQPLPSLLPIQGWAREDWPNFPCKPGCLTQVDGQLPLVFETQLFCCRSARETSKHQQMPCLSFLRGRRAVPFAVPLAFCPLPSGPSFVPPKETFLELTIHKATVAKKLRIFPLGGSQ